MYLVARPRPFEPRTVISTHSSPTRTEMLPPVGVRMPLIILERVVLPPPEMPTRPKISPSLTSRLTSSTAFTTPRSMLMYLFERPLALIIGSPSSTSSRLAKVPAMARN